MSVEFHRRTHLFLSGFKYITTMQEKRLHLVNTARGDEDEVENRKQSQLKVKTAVSDLPEGETTEKCCENMEDDLVPHVILGERQLLQTDFVYRGNDVPVNARCEY